MFHTKYFVYFSTVAVVRLLHCTFQCNFSFCIGMFCFRMRWGPKRLEFDYWKWALFVSSWSKHQHLEQCYYNIISVKYVNNSIYICQFILDNFHLPPRIHILMAYGLWPVDQHRVLFRNIVIKFSFVDFSCLSFFFLNFDDISKMTIKEKKFK